MPSQHYNNPLTGRVFSPRLNVPTEFYLGMSYEDQILLLLAMLQDALEKGDIATITRLWEAINSKEAIEDANAAHEDLSNRITELKAEVEKQISEFIASMIPLTSGEIDTIWASVPSGVDSIVLLPMTNEQIDEVMK